ncbi:hypothetical protein MJ046_05630 [Acinetobacter bereziniae]|uniref:hypothetical protein n=1 Tax=Acinetobacter bereziniae TaxID=106648 RepID=UPI0022EAE739|nr:hypothetical protein [Acinetobacter bereziniae]MDA3439816.1 hypothetical protein [Acinetobacter bereziniae]
MEYGLGIAAVSKVFYSVANFIYLAIGGSQFVIGEKYHGTENGSTTLFYLIKIKPKIEVYNLGESYAVDGKYNLSYKDSAGNNKNIKLN